jgi:hypothetical protein
LIVIGVYMAQPFLTAASLDLSAKISVVAFSVAIPLLAALVMLNRQETFRRRLTKSVLVEITRVVAQMSAFTGVVAGSGAWNGIRSQRPRREKNPATPSHNPFECERADPRLRQGGGVRCRRFRTRQVDRRVSPQAEPGYSDTDPNIQTPARFPELDLQVSIGTIPQNVLALNQRVLDIVYAYLPFDSPRTPRYLRLGVIEHLLAIPERHRLASMEMVSREELVNERFVIGPKGLNPPAVEEVFRSLFGTSLPPNPVETSDAGTNRFKLVSEGVAISVVGFPMEALLPIRGVVYRRVADPSPTIEYGLLWFEDSPSPALPAFLELARGSRGRIPRRRTAGSPVVIWSRTELDDRARSPRPV